MNRAECEHYSRLLEDESLAIDALRVGRESLAKQGFGPHLSAWCAMCEGLDIILTADEGLAACDLCGRKDDHRHGWDEYGSPEHEEAYEYAARGGRGAQ